MRVIVVHNVQMRQEQTVTTHIHVDAEAVRGDTCHMHKVRDNKSHMQEKCEVSNVL